MPWCFCDYPIEILGRALGVPIGGVPYVGATAHTARRLCGGRGSRPDYEAPAQPLPPAHLDEGMRDGGESNAQQARRKNARYRPWPDGSPGAA